MNEVALDQVVELALKLTILDQAKLLERVAAHLAREVDIPQGQGSPESLANRIYEIWSPHDEGGVVAALNQALQEHEQQKQSPDAE